MIKKTQSRVKNSGKTEYALKLAENRKIKSKNVSDYFVNFIRKYHQPWMQELADRYKSLGDFPIFPIAILPSYYGNILDREIAAFVAVLIKNDQEFWRINDFHELLGENPWQWFANRDFVILSIGKLRDERTGGVENWKIAQLMDNLWGAMFSDKKDYCGLHDVIMQLAEKRHCTYFKVIVSFMKYCKVDDYENKLRLLLLVLCTSDGLGMSVWYGHIRNEVKCPILPGMRQFVETWFPNYRQAGDIDHAIKMFGLKGDCDFFYAYLGYKELQKRNPKACSRYSTKYNIWYSLCSDVKRIIWKEVIPEIPF